MRSSHIKPLLACLSLSPHSPSSLTFNQKDYYGVSSSTITATSLPDGSLQNFNMPKRLGTSLRVY